MTRFASSRFAATVLFRLWAIFGVVAAISLVLTMATGGTRRADALPLAGSRLPVEDSVVLAIDDILHQIMPVLKEKRYKVIQIGKFEGPQGTSVGPELQVKFASAIQKHEGFSVDRIDFDVSIKGRIEQLDLDNAVAVRLVVQLFDAKSNKPVGQFSGAGGGSADQSEVSANVLGHEAIPRLLGIPVSFSGDEDRNERNSRIQENLDGNPYLIKGSEVFPAGDSLYSMEILVINENGEYEPVSAVAMGRRELPFAGIPMDRVFAVRLNNHSPIEAAANLTLDGISSFAFSEVRSTASSWLVPPAVDGKPGSVLVTGWDIDDKSSSEFKNVGYPDSAAKKLNLEPNEAMGQICVHFSESYEVGQAGARAVGFGERIVAEKQSVPRDIGPLRATIHIRYERGATDQ